MAGDSLAYVVLETTGIVIPAVLLTELPLGKTVGDNPSVCHGLSLKLGDIRLV